MSTPTDIPPQSPASPGSGVFSECREACPFHRLANNTGATEHDCAHPENSPHLPIEQTPCDDRICPIFWSDDPEGDEENMRYPHEVEGHWHLPNKDYANPVV